MDIRWEDPPPMSRSFGWTGEILAALLERPNEWAIVLEVPREERATAQSQRENLIRVSATKGYKIEATTKTVDQATRVYARVITEGIN